MVEMVLMSPLALGTFFHSTLRVALRETQSVFLNIPKVDAADMSTYSCRFIGSLLGLDLDGYLAIAPASKGQGSAKTQLEGWAEGPLGIRSP